MGLKRLTASEGSTCSAGFTAAATQTQAALHGESDSIYSFTGAAQGSLLQVWDQVCAFQGDNTVQLQFVFTLCVPGRYQVSSIMTQSTQSGLMQTYKDMLAVPILCAKAEEILARLHSLQSGVGTEWMDVLPTKETWELDEDAECMPSSI